MAKKLVVTAPLVIAKTSEGRDLYLYQGAVVPGGQSKEWLKRHRDDKLIGLREIAERDMPAGDGSSGESSTEEPDPVKAFLDRDADEVIADVGTLDAEQRALVAAEEESGKNRVTVLRALRGES